MWVGLWMGLAGIPSSHAQDMEVDVVALFKGAALLEINGRRELLKEGEKTAEGVELIEATSRKAIVAVGDQRVTLDLSSRIGTAFQPPVNATVSINLNNDGQYRTTGSINDRPVALLVDTGANIVAMNSVHARELGINYRAGRASQASTAGGVIRTWEVTLDSVQVGQIRVNNVRAAVLDGAYPEDILLGMTFLTSVEINESSGVMILKSKL